MKCHHSQYVHVFNINILQDCTSGLIYLNMTFAYVIFVLNHSTKFWSILLYLSFRNESEMFRWTRIAYLKVEKKLSKIRFLKKLSEELLCSGDLP